METSLQPIQLPQTSARTSFLKRYWIFFGIAGFLVVVGLIRLVYGNTPLNASRITDQAFVSRASTICERYLPDLQRQQPQRGEELKNTEIVPKIRSTADQMQKMRMELRALPVAVKQDKKAVDLWIHSWDNYIAAGYAYANALETNNKAEWNRLGEASTSDSRNITAFALVNKMPACAMRTQQSSSIM